MTFPDALRNGSSWMSPPWFDPQELPPAEIALEDIDRWRHFQAWTRFRLAQDELLGTLTERPAGISVLQFLTAHGLTVADVGTPKAMHLVF